MVLTFCGRKDEDVYNGYLNKLFGLVARSLQSLVGKVSKSGMYKTRFTIFCWLNFFLTILIKMLNKLRF